MADPATLLPCPFCGGAPSPDEPDEDCFCVRCDECGFDLMGGPVGLGWWSTAEAAAGAWNRRAGLEDAAADLLADDQPLNAMQRAISMLLYLGQRNLADRLHLARLRVEKLADAAAVGTESSGDYAITPGLVFGPQRATVLRDSLKPFKRTPADVDVDAFGRTAR